jgi:hypothetical protein
LTLLDVSVLSHGWLRVIKAVFESDAAQVSFYLTTALAIDFMLVTMNVPVRIPAQSQPVF